MKGLDEFIALFGDVTILHAVEVILAIVFAIGIYKKVKDYLIKRHDAEMEKNAELQEALTAVRKYPLWHQQSLDIQQMFKAEIQELRDIHKETSDRLIKMEADNKRRERNKLRDRLLQNFRYYTNLETNPSQTWTRMESEAFWVQKRSLSALRFLRESERFCSQQDLFPNSELQKESDSPFSIRFPLSATQASI